MGHPTAPSTTPFFGFVGGCMPCRRLCHSHDRARQNSGRGVRGAGGFVGQTTAFAGPGVRIGGRLGAPTTVLAIATVVGVMSLPVEPATPRRAWVRAPSDAYARCLRVDDTVTPDVDRALEQHHGYVAALRRAGVDVEILPPVAGLPDACFVEDVAVILDPEVAVLTRPGEAARRPEGAAIEPRLAEVFALERMQAPATLDGGDVLRLGARLLVGSSRRTNEAGFEQLRGLAALRGLEVLGIPVTAGLHLKSACTALDATTVLVDEAALDPGLLRDLGLRVHAVPEPLGANVLALGDRVLVSAAAPKTARWLESRGHTVVRISLDEFHRGDGALSCLSLRQAAPGSWVV